MNRALAIAAVFVASTALAAPKTKKAPDRFVQAASEAFKAAEAADAKNDLTTARGLYTKAFVIAPHSSTAYNLADVERRAGKLYEAVQWYELYLLLSPDASDLKEVNATIAQLQATTTILHVDSQPPSDMTSMDLGTAYILFDGNIVKRAGVPVAEDTGGEPMLDLDAPQHAITIDTVTALSFDTRVCTYNHRDTKRACRVSSPPRVDGSITISSNEHTIGVFEVGKPATKMIGRRTKLSPGKHTFMVSDRDIECQTFTVDVPANHDIAYVFVRAETAEYRERCRSIEIVQHRLVFK
ncbi:MAG TPA: hypothetical protein VGM39_12665 [Kofleriaceae bacterium]